jgi:hypothetical protein
MNILTMSDFKRKTNEELKKLMPIKLTHNGEVFCFVGQAEDFIFIGDLHPRVKIQFRAKEQMVRKGMPKDTTIDYELPAESIAVAEG